MTVPLTPGAGKKPHQRKRHRAERMTTVTAKKARILLYHALT